MINKEIKIAIIIGFVGYQDTEFGTPYQYFIDHKVDVKVYSTQKGIAKGTNGGTFNVEHELSKLNVKDYDAIVFVGGSGTLLVRNNINSIKIIKKAFEENKIIAAICWSPTVLAKAGILKGKNATVWHGLDPEFGILTSEYLEKQGAKYTDQDVTIDGNIITANGPRAALKYAIEIWNKLIEISKNKT